MALETVYPDSVSQVFSSHLRFPNSGTNEWFGNCDDKARSSMIFEPHKPQKQIVIACDNTNPRFARQSSTF